MTAPLHTDSVDRFVLRWHRAAVTLTPAALPRWLLASMAALVTFGQGLWVVGLGAVGPVRSAVAQTAAAGSRPSAPLQAGSLHALGLPDDLPASPTGTWLLEQALACTEADGGRATATALPASNGPLQAGQPMLALREPDAPADRQQLMALLRPAGEPAFGADEQRLLERLAPHAMQALTTARTLAEALHAAQHRLPEGYGQPGVPPASTVPPEPLSEFELTVARLYAAGCTDREITQQLGLATGEVRLCLRSVFAKLGVASRAQVAVLVG